MTYVKQSTALLVIDPYDGAHTCMEATVRFAAELGYEVTVVRDATASYSDDHMHAALDVNLPNYASAIVTADQVVDALS